MEKAYLYEIRLEGTLAGPWTDWFEGLVVSHPVEGETLLCGPLPDQAALIGLLVHVHNLNLVLVSVERRQSNADDADSADSRGSF